MALLFNCTISEILNGKRLDRTSSSNLPVDLSKDLDILKNYDCNVEVDFDFNSSVCISPFLFGDNLEHTRDCINSGLSAQMLKNRKFAGKPGRYGCATGWYQIGERPFFSFGPSYTRHYAGYRMNRAHECNSQVITNYHPELAGIGQKELFLKCGEQYEFRVVAKAFSQTVLCISLTGTDGTIYDQKEFIVNTDVFSEIQLTLCPNADDSNANIEITFSSVGTVEIGALSLMPCENFHGMRLDVIEKMKEIGMKVLRWPGGNFAGEYNWKDGLLPRDERAPFQSYLWLETQPHTMGYDYHEINTDDFLALCKEIGAEPYLTLNPAWNTPEESAQWVEYCNGEISTEYGKLRAMHGHPEPYHVQFWSLGNEAGYGHMEGANTPIDYASTVIKHAEKMLQVSPGLTLCSSGPYPNQEWADHSAKALCKVAPVVSLHHYAGYPRYIDPAKRKEEYYTFINKVYSEFKPRLLTLRKQLNDDNIKISYDEWNAWYAWYRGGSVSEGIMTASFLNMLFQNADNCGVTLACHFESVNEGALQVRPDGARLTPTGQVLSLMSHHAGGILCALKDDVTATRKGGILTCTLLNRSFDTEKKFMLPDIGELINESLYSADDIVPNTVFTQSALPMTKKENTLEILLPAHSVAQVQIKLPETM